MTLRPSTYRKSLRPTLRGGGGGGGGGGGLPTDGLVSMLDGSIASSFYSDIAKTTNSTEGGAVAVWEDQSGNGNDWTQPNASYQPIALLSTNRLHNNPGAPSAATDKHLVGPDISGWAEGSFFARVQTELISSTQGGLWGTTTWNSSGSMNHWNFSSTHYVTFGTDQRFNVGSNTINHTDLISYEENVSSSALLKIYSDGVEKLSQSSAGNVAFRTTPVLGAAIRAGAIQYSGKFYFYKFCAYNRVVTAEERVRINAWLESV